LPPFTIHVAKARGVRAWTTYYGGAFETVAMFPRARGIPPDSLPPFSFVPLAEFAVLRVNQLLLLFLRFIHRILGKV
jgi:hypothetical protein